MTTTAYQYTIFSKIKFGLSMLFRCFNCFHNVFEKIYFLAFAQQSCPNTIPFIYCPYCGYRVYALEEQPGDYELLLSFDQDPLFTLSLKIKGTSGASYTIVWDDNTLSTGTFDGTLQTFTHDYTTAGNYNIKFFFEPEHLIEFEAINQAVTGSYPSLLDFINLSVFRLNYGSMSGSISSFDGLQKLALWSVRSQDLSGIFPGITNLPLLTNLVIRDCKFTGNFPIITGCPELSRITARDHTWTGNAPDISNLPKIYRITFFNGNFNGTIPALGNLPLLDRYFVPNNFLTNDIPSFTGCLVINKIQVQVNQLSGYLSSTLSLTLIEFRAENNLLTQAAVDQILSDFNTNLASRPGSGTINLGGTGNATPSAAGLIHKANIIAHGWTVTTN